MYPISNPNTGRIKYRLDKGAVGVDHRDEIERLEETANLGGSKRDGLQHTMHEALL